MSKAYDRIEWTFLEDVLERLGFHSTWVAWVMECVSSVSYSFLINGAAQGKVVPSRGLRQGDPISPYLFIICTEVLSQLCHQAQQVGSLCGIRVSRKSPKVSHLLFADDTMFFCATDKKSCLKLKYILNSYEAASGQSVNVVKSAITFSSKTPRRQRRQAAAILGISRTGGSGKYLGLPESFDIKKKDIFAATVDKVRQKSHSWTNKFLSAAGKVIMLKSVLTAMPSFTLSCFKLPISLCDKLQSIFTRFWWDASPEVRKMSWVAWSKLTLPKNAGGLGFREVESFNDALLAKIGWKLINQPESLMAKVLLGKYCANSSFLDSTPPKNSSYGWSGILHGRKVLRKGLGWLIGDGSSISVWSDHWLSTAEPLAPIGPSLPAHASLKVSDLSCSISGQWDVQQIRRFIPAYESVILQLLPPKPNRKDSLSWLPVKSGQYTTRSGYGIQTSTIIQDQTPPLNWQKHIWKVKASPKTVTFLWKMAVTALPVGDQLRRRGMDIPFGCKRCGMLETVDHVFFECEFAQNVWKLAPISLLSVSRDLSVNGFLKAAPSWTNLPPSGLTSPLYPWICWFIWVGRNKLVFEDKQFTEAETISKAITEAKLWAIAQTELPIPKSHLPTTPIPPEADLIAFVDAAWRSQSLACGMGWHYWSPSDPLTSILAQDFSMTKLLVPSVLAAEAWALLYLLKHAFSSGIRVLQVRSDSQTLIRILNSTEQHNDLHGLLQDIRSITLQFLSISFYFIPRDLNCKADGIAKAALQTLDHVSFLG